MQKYLKNNKGFTLVEVIVVAVIVLVLAAVAIPLYNGYIRDSRQNVAQNTAASIAAMYTASKQVHGCYPNDCDGTDKATVSNEDPKTITVKPAHATGDEDDDNTLTVPKGFTFTDDDGLIKVTHESVTGIEGCMAYKSGVNCPESDS